MTHEQLAALLDSASSAGASQLATKLAKASSTITKIGDDLMTYVKGLEWQGEGGDAFRDWGGQSAAATLRLGQYAEVASRWMATVAQAVAEAKASMPATSETTRAEADLADARKAFATTQEPGARNDPDARRLAQTAQSDAAAAQQRMEATRAEAIQQLRKLAQTYEYSAQQVNSVEPPTFAPPANHLPPGAWQTPEHYVPLEAGGPGSTTGASSHPAGNVQKSEVPNPTGTGTTDRQTALTSSSRSQHAQPQPAAMNIDGVTSLAETPNTAPLSTTVPQNGSGPRLDGSYPVQPVLGQPMRTGQVRVPGPQSPPRTPAQVRPSLLPGQTGANGSFPRHPRETGIIGGRPVSPNAGRPSTGLPRGTVIGGDPSQGRMPLGPVASPSSNMGAGSASGQSTAHGPRRLAETGGVVGSRPVQPGGTSPRPFAAGGAGLVRPQKATDPSNGSVAGRAGGTVNSIPKSAFRRDIQQGQSQRRPDYLVEDDETWASTLRRTVPPVVD
ncbi:hypothetical protein ACFY3O_25840 [Streptomyces sp. NPDC001046]|uniref:WXG100 family type VII secretion target n=1 Tax=Streptomyces sp. NPDC001046 TaxID=3364543 RepID=UPI00367E40F9